MALKITRASDPISVEQLVLCIYAAPGLGKTTAGFTAEAPLLLDFDGGVHRAGNRKDSVPIRSWAEVAGITAADLAGYKTLVVDTAGRALDFLTLSVIESDPRMGNKAGALSLQGYGALKVAFASWLSRIKQTGLDVVLIAHMDEQRKGDDVIERLDVQGGSKNEIYKSADAMGRIYMSNGQRVLNFSPSDVGFGKNPGALEPMAIPDFARVPDFLAGVIAQIKAKLNSESDAQARARQEAEEARKRFAQLDSAEAFNEEAVNLSLNGDPRLKRLLLDVATEKGFHFDKKSKEFRATAAA